LERRKHEGVDRAQNLGNVTASPEEPYPGSQPQVARLSPERCSRAAVGADEHEPYARGVADAVDEESGGFEQVAEIVHRCQTGQRCDDERVRLEAEPLAALLAIVANGIETLQVDGVPDHRDRNPPATEEVCLCLDQPTNGVRLADETVAGRLVGDRAEK